MREIKSSSDVTVYPDCILRLNSVAGFIDAVYDYIEHKGSTLAAYEFVEAMHERYFGRRRYEDYLYFLQARSKYWRRRMK